MCRCGNEEKKTLSYLEKEMVFFVEKEKIRILTRSTSRPRNMVMVRACLPVSTTRQPFLSQLKDTILGDKGRLSALRRCRWSSTPTESRATIDFFYPLIVLKTRDFLALDLRDRFIFGITTPVF